MKINDRLKTIGDLVSANSFCLDVGCDHAFLCIYLVKKNMNIKAIASDVLEGPLKHARENIKRGRDFFFRRKYNVFRLFCRYSLQRK